MAQPIILTNTQLRLLQRIGKGYGEGLSFSNVRISSSAGALCDWHNPQQAWDNLSNAINVGCIDLEISREDLVSYLEWFDKRDKDREEFRRLIGVRQKNTEAEQSLFVFLKLVQAFNYPQDVKKDE